MRGHPGRARRFDSARRRWQRPFARVRGGVRRSRRTTAGRSGLGSGCPRPVPVYDVRARSRRTLESTSGSHSSSPSARFPGRSRRHRHVATPRQTLGDTCDKRHRKSLVRGHATRGQRMHCCQVVSSPRGDVHRARERIRVAGPTIQFLIRATRAPGTARRGCCRQARRHRQVQSTGQ
jgi:hypothetical protein